MRKKKTDAFSCFLFFLLIMAVFFFIRLLTGMQEEKKQYTVLLSLGNLDYNEDFIKKAAKIKGIKEIWPVVEIPVSIRIEDYTKETAFLGIDFNAFGTGANPETMGNSPVLLLGISSLLDMKDTNGHFISRKQQKKYLEQGKNLNISYCVSQEETQEQNRYLPCKVIRVFQKEPEGIYIPLSQAQTLCRENKETFKITKIYLKINGQKNLEKAKRLFES